MNRSQSRSWRLLLLKSFTIDDGVESVVFIVLQMLKWFSNAQDEKRFSVLNFDSKFTSPSFLHD
jgi:hypothetical protein